MFSVPVWIALLVTLFIMALLFLFIYKWYQNSLTDSIILGPYIDNMDFFIRTFASFTEPESLKWFPKYSAGKTVCFFFCYNLVQILPLITGKIIVATWVFLSLAMVFFYQSLLRSFLISPAYEKKIDTRFVAISLQLFYWLE